jgi:lipooligosaccharide transport system permease protein
MILTPITPKEIVLGEILWGASKGCFSACGVTLVASFFGHIDTWLIIPALGVVFISSVIFSAVGLLVTSWVKNFEMIIYATSGFIVPMSLFSGTYFPLQELPMGLEYLGYLFPLTHSVACVRELLLVKSFSPAFSIHLTVLIVLAFTFTRWAVRRIDSKLTQ